jgi:hypothetical protein
MMEQNKIAPSYGALLRRRGKKRAARRPPFLDLKYVALQQLPPRLDDVRLDRLGIELVTKPVAELGNLVEDFPCAFANARVPMVQGEFVETSGIDLFIEDFELPENFRRM